MKGEWESKKQGLRQCSKEMIQLRALDEASDDECQDTLPISMSEGEGKVDEIIIVLP